MKRLNERTQIGEALNLGKYPVLTIDLADRTEYGLKGCKVRIDCGTFRSGERYLQKAELYVYSDEKRFTFHAGCSCLSASFGYSDLMEDLSYASAPIVTADQDIVIVIYDSKRGLAWSPYLVHTGATVSRFCSTPLTVERVDLSEFF